MTVEQIIDYVLKTPYNVNPNVLRGMLVALQTGDNPDLSFVNAEAGDIMNGKFGVSSTGAKVIGTYVPLDTSDATATAEDIAKDKTAYVNGEKIVGKYEAPAVEETPVENPETPAE